ncbi:hypothetical protein N9O29_01100 [Alphaproteobacteria bacterium]|nr:hypothetical protein [Alphaproteobacteria bacterium]
MLIRVIFIFVTIFINKSIAEEICPKNEQDISVHLITDGYYNYEDYLHYSLGKFSSLNNNKYNLNVSKELNLGSINSDVIFGEFHELQKIINKESKLATPEYIQNFYQKNNIKDSHQNNNLYPLDLDTYILVSKEKFNNVENEEDIYNFFDQSKYTLSQSFYSKSETINFMSFLLMDNVMNFENPFFESILFNQKSKYSLLNKNTFLGSYEEVIDSFHNNENLFTVLPDGFAYHENINFINYPNSEKIWDKEIGKFKSNDLKNMTSFYGFSALVNKESGFNFLCYLTTSDSRKIIMKNFNLGISPLTINDLSDIDKISSKYKELLKLKSQNIRNLNKENITKNDEDFHKNIIKFIINQSDLILHDGEMSFFKTKN